MHERLKKARKSLKMSQAFVAEQMQLSRPTISAIESGQRKVSAEELARFSKLYGISVDELMYGKISTKGQIDNFTRLFAELSEIDQREILNLIDFKRKFKTID
ncbi:Helix-turn-helix [Butyrivibrio fibrisolvens DSM 3071]|uniref:Helix-turn-helix n=1 Tax=Butyrivibrio fibrisolvens DSM 3071 TaxID=1121131 RepID=A0A1M5Q320_BUTFI|nr:helix-turn-helix transcriptional regulator [Butyrivibrio fibrisolvens]SHH07883.1 Helix-turn-helix [Butyrivibrio fibrisolvens DSM 3071]